MRQRLDQALVDRGLVETRARARGLILRGLVSVDGKTAAKPGELIGEASAIAVAEAAGSYVSFGADKLRAALDHLQGEFNPEGRIALDVGASTGGLTDVLMSRGAAKVYAVDVGRGQLHLRLRSDPRVVSLEATDARALSRALVPDPISAVVADTSFISLTKVLEPALALTVPGAWLIALIKPKFEVGPASVGSGGIVRDNAERARARAIVTDWIAAHPGWRVDDVIVWPGLEGRSNEEYLIGAHRRV